LPASSLFLLQATSATAAMIQISFFIGGMIRRLARPALAAGSSSDGSVEARHWQMPVQYVADTCVL
jgi:hypothetical protein